MGALILKVLVASALISIAIKYGGAYLRLQPTPVTALILVLAPSLLMAIAFGVRWQQQQP